MRDSDDSTVLKQVLLSSGRGPLASLSVGQVPLSLLASSSESRSATVQANAGNSGPGFQFQDCTLLLSVAGVYFGTLKRVKCPLQKDKMATQARIKGEGFFCVLLKPNDV